MKKFVCPLCGSEEIYKKIWRDFNTGEDSYNGDVYCTNCDSYINPIEKEI